MARWTAKNTVPVVVFLFALAVSSVRVSRSLGQDRANEPSLNRFPRMVQEYFVGRVRASEHQRLVRLQGIQTREEAQAYVQEVREKIRASFGEFPERNPLNARVTGVLERDGYRIENVIFESRPGFLVTANLYIPETDPLPRPAVIGTCGHSDNGKAAEPYQAFSQGLVKQGYVVLIYDPISQGERLQYVDSELKSRHGAGVREHLYAGNQQFLVGEFFGTWRVWDGIRALDYLLSRPEVDQDHVGVTGNSGGGTLTTWLCGLEDRWTMAAPSCFVTSFRRNLENELPADTEQCPPRVLALGLDHEEFLAAMAPKPVIVLTKERDYFDVRGGEQAFRHLKELYRCLGKEDQIALFTGPTAHGYSQENREAMYGWFNQATGKPRVDTAEPTIQIEPDERLWCAPQGQVVNLGSRSIQSFTADRARLLKRDRKSLRGDALRQAVKRVVCIDSAGDVPEYRILRPRERRGFPLSHFTTYAVETEPGIQAIVYRLNEQSHLSRPPQGHGPALLYISHLSSDAELRNDAWLRELISRHHGVGVDVFTCDVRGTGDSQPDTCDHDSFLQPYGNDYFYAVHAMMLGDPYPGQKTRDVLRVVQWLRAQGRTEIHLVAQGRGTIPAALAALCCEDVHRVTLRKPLSSFQSLAESESYTWPLSSFIPGVLASWDLPDIYATLAQEKRLALEDIVGPNGEPARLDEGVTFVASPVTSDHAFTPGIEGPACDALGNIYAVNFAEQQTVGRITPEGLGEVFVRLPGESVGNGIRFAADGAMIVADYVGHNLLRVDPQSRQISILAHDDQMSQPNDLAIGPDGVIYASDPKWSEGTGQLWRIDVDGTITRLASGMGTTNGIEVSPDGRTLYVNESVQRKIWAFTVNAEHELTEKRLLCEFPDHGFDGMRCDVKGNLYVTRHGKGTVVVLSSRGELLHEVDVLGTRPSNLCFGGPDGRTVYVTEVDHGRLVQFRSEHPGLAWQRWARTSQGDAP